MAGTVSNTNIKPVWVVFNDVNLGLCEEEDITLTVDVAWNDKTAHQTGTHLLDSFFGGARVTVTANISEIENLDNWKVAFGFGQKQNDAATPPKSRFAFENKTNYGNSQYVGTRATTIAQELRLIPLSKGGTPGTEDDDDFAIPKAFCRSVGDIVHSVTTGQALPMTFEALFNPAATDGFLAVVGRVTATAGAWTGV